MAELHTAQALVNIYILFVIHFYLNPIKGVKRSFSFTVKMYVPYHLHILFDKSSGHSYSSGLLTVNSIQTA